MGDMYNRGGGALTPTSVTTTADVEIGGDLTVSGTTTTIETTNTVISDKLIELANGTSGTPSGDAGIIIERGSSDNAAFVWDESINSFVVGTTTATGASTGDLSVTDGALKAGSLDISGNVDVDGILETDALTIDGVTLSETIADTVGAMVTSNTESGITVAYQDADNTLDFTVSTLNQDTSGTAAIATTVTCADESSDTSCFVGYVTAATGDLGVKTGSNLTFNSSNGTLGATEFSGGGVGITGLNGSNISSGTVAVARVATLNQDTTGTAAIATTVTVADESSDTSCNVLFTTAATGDLPPKSGTNLTFNSSNGLLTATSLAGTLTTAAQTNITSVGTIGTGVWQGTVVASAYLDADTAHLSGSQTFTGTKTLNSFKGTGGATVTNILDEDAMGTNSATALATQQSIKAYADTKSPVAGHSSIVTVGTIGTGTWQGTAVASAYLDADTAHLSGTQTFTGTKTLNSFKGTGGATVTNILDEDAMGSDSATALATQQSIKAYADTKSVLAGSSSITTVGTVGTGTWQGTAVASAYLDAQTAHLDTVQTFTGAKTFSADVVISGTTPTLTIGDAGAEDTMLVFDGNAADFRIGLDDGTDTLEIGKGAAHGTTPVIKIDSSTNCQIMHNSAVADGEFEGDLVVLQAGENLTAGEVVYFKSDGKCWKAVATAAATSRCVAMATATISANAMGVFLLKGFVRFASEFPTFTIGAPVYTPEAETANASDPAVDVNVPEVAAPDGDGDFVQIIGWALSADAMYFNPDSTVIEVA